MSKVFIVHGHDQESLKELKALLTSLGVEPIVLFQATDSGKTVIENFEHYANRCEFAVILLTPDDRDASFLPESERYRARQNVIFEMGWFFARLGRKKTLLIYRGSVELPSDVTGILYKEFKRSPSELTEDIKDALLSGGVRLRVRTRRPR